MLPRRFLSTFMILVLASIACNLSVSTPVASTPPTAVLPTATLPPPTLTLEQLKNMEIKITGVSDTVKVRTVKLTDGRFEAGSDRAALDYVSVNMGHQVAFGDLNNDGLDDAAIIIGENYGGSGTFVSVVAVLNQNGDPVFAGSYGIDDRPKINDLSIRDGEILAESVVHGPGDPGCCPEMKAKQTYRFWNEKLILTRYTSQIPTGKERIIKLISPAPEAEVPSAFIITGSVTVSPFENNLAYTVFFDGDPNPLVQSSLMVNATQMGDPGVFQLPLDFTEQGIKGKLRIQISDISAADGSYIAIATLFVTIK